MPLLIDQFFQRLVREDHNLFIINNSFGTRLQLLCLQRTAPVFRRQVHKSRFLYLSLLVLLDNLVKGGNARPLLCILDSTLHLVPTQVSVEFVRLPPHILPILIASFQQPVELGVGDGAFHLLFGWLQDVAVQVINFIFVIISMGDDTPFILFFIPLSFITAQLLFTDNY